MTRLSISGYGLWRAIVHTAAHDPYGGLPAASPGVPEPDTQPEPQAEPVEE